MANHPISLISPIQIVQTSIANNSARNAPSSPELPSSGAATSDASVSTAGNPTATDVHLMQSSDATTFVYGSTKSNESAAANNYTTVDDAAKLATKVAADNDVIDEIKRDDKKKKKEKRPQEKNSKKDSKSEEVFQEPAGDGYHLKNTMMVASHGIV